MDLNESSHTPGRKEGELDQATNENVNTESTLIDLQSQTNQNELDNLVHEQYKLSNDDQNDKHQQNSQSNDEVDSRTINQHDDKKQLKDETSLESNNFSKTNTGIHSGINVESKIESQTSEKDCRTLTDREIENIKKSLTIEEEAKENLSTNLNRFDLPDLVSSSDQSKRLETIDKKSSTTFEEDIPSYQVKWIKFRNKQCAIITQNVNGPCPLLAICNLLLLKNKINLPLNTKIVTYDQMIVFLANFILENGTNNAPEGFQLDYEQNISDAMQLFPKLQTGLDVNVQFNSITSFEYTSEMIIFDLLGISLYHGWIVDQDDVETATVIGNCSYNQLVDKIITNKSSSKSEEVTEALIGERFLESTASQLTYYGLSELVTNVKEQELCILFRNNHFITLYKNQNQLYQLVTDQGFLQEPDVVWMTLSHIDNDDVFVNHEFKPSTFKLATLSPGEQKKQIDQDYLIALCIEEEEKKLASQNQQQMIETNEYENETQYKMMSDEELARKLQEEEDEREREEYLKRANENCNKMVQTVDDPQYNWPTQRERSDHNRSQLMYRHTSLRDSRNELMRNKTRTPNNTHSQLNSPNDHTQSSSNNSSSRVIVIVIIIILRISVLFLNNLFKIKNVLLSHNSHYLVIKTYL